MRWIDATDLDAWADRLDCRSRMPEILRRLIHATVDSPARVDFPSAESVQGGGWDGILETTEAASPIPQGTSGWEISARRGSKKKADEDYEKRKTDPLGLNPGDTTFVFVTPRRWSQKRKWENEKKGEGFWADVRVLDADDLEQWLERSEAVSASLATTIGKYPKGVQSLEDCWQEYSKATQPAIPRDLLLVGRDRAVREVWEWLDGPSSILHVHADSTDEAVAFFAAVVLDMDEGQRNRHLSRILIGTDVDVLRNLSATGRGLKIVWLANDQSAAPNATAHGHHVFVPLARTVQASGETGILLSRPRREQFRKALKNSGLREEEVDDLTKDSGSSISVLRRRTAVVPTVSQPEWATPAIGALLVPALLAGSWTETSHGDRGAIIQLAGTSYEEFVKHLPGLAGGADSPLRRVGNAWTLAAPLDAWYLLAPYLTIDHLRMFEEVSVEVLGLKHPRLDLEPHERWMASAYGKDLPHSRWLREGLAHSLILLAVVGERRALHTSRRPAATTSVVVRRLLGEDSNWETWYSLSDTLPLLAEAAPEQFLESLEDCLERDSSIIKTLFAEEGGGLSPSYHHTGLLWALEILAWFPAYLSRATRILGRLAHLDPGVKMLNTPKNSLRSIFLPWFPQTAAFLEGRLSAIDLLVERDPETGWALLLDLLPKGSDHSTHNPEPRWREKPSRSPLTNAEHFESIDALSKRAIEAADLSASRLAELVTHLTSLPPRRREEVVAKLGQFAAAPVDQKGLWDNLRELLHHHRKYQDADWSLPPQELDALGEILNRLEPPDIVVRSAFLFDDGWPNIPNPARSGPDSYVEEEKQIDDARTTAVLAIAGARGLEGLHSLARTAKNPQWVGLSAGKSLDDPVVEEEVLRSLANPDEPIRQFSMGFVGGRAWSRGDSWVESVFGSARWDTWGPDEKAHFCLSLRGTREVWGKVSANGEEAMKIYWSRVWPRVSADDSASDIEYAIEKLVYGNQAYNALLFADQFRKKISPGLLKHVLDQVYTSITDGSLRGYMGSLDYHIDQVLSCLRESPDFDETELATLEWKFLPLFRWGSQPVTLHRWLSRDPAFFVEVIKLVFGPRTKGLQEGAKSGESTELRKNRAQLAYELLSRWNRIPGTLEDGSIDEGQLGDWVNRARQLCAESDRAVVGDQRIGTVLAHAPADADGTWPHRAVRSLVENLESRHLERGMELGIHNMRGVTPRALDTGGEPERRLAHGYREAAEKVRMRWPRTAAMLDRIAEGYEQEGRREDDQSEEFETRG